VKQPCVYILASREHGTLYIGVTSDLLARLYQHRTKATQGFTSHYSVYRLVWFEFYETMPEAISREKQLKRWHRQWKINLIESENPQWADLAPGLGLPPLPSP
jgi:putative endonuclease